MTEDEMVGWHHRLNGHEFEQAPGVGDGQGSLAWASPWGCSQTQLSDRRATTLFSAATFFLVEKLRIIIKIIAYHEKLMEA